MNAIKLSLISFILLLVSSCGNKSKSDSSNNVMRESDSDTTNVSEGSFSIPEVEVAASPDGKTSLSLSKDEKVIDYDVSPAGRIVAVIIRNKSKDQISFWGIDQKEITESYKLPEGFKCSAIAWHPQANALFVMGSLKSENRILRIAKTDGEWTNKCVFKTPKVLRRLLVCPRPFVTGYDSNTEKSYYAYRLFFGMDNGDGSFRIVSATESGKIFYQTIGPSKTITNLDPDFPPSGIIADWALPIAFHPAGHNLIWEDKNNRFHIGYYYGGWGSGVKPTNNGIKSGGTITPTPNGLGFIHWQKSKSGVGIYIQQNKREESQLTEYNFISTPSSVPDGKGIVGLTKTKDIYTLNYLPINVPLADVSNAWMFINTPEELKKFQSNYGLFRTNQSDQLYKLYETENYVCDSYDDASPTRPYLVTTDIFWELFSAAYQGLFIIKERDEAIPAFWKFIEKANVHYKSKDSKWNKVFAVLQNYKSLSFDAEVKRIASAVDGVSDITKEVYSFSNLKPRGHYTGNYEMERYFKAFRYFTTILSKDQAAIKELELMPNEIAQYAEKWIDAYTGFIAPSRSALVWKGIKQPLPAYCKYPKDEVGIFPLSWGFDNEIFYSTVYHEDSPEDLQVKGAGGFRLSPSGLDLASVFGNKFAENLLQSDLEKYPPLKKVINNLKDNYSTNSSKADFTKNLYNKWINAIATQWLDTVSSPNGNKDRDLWQTKRLQTGLASWATLRHATVLVNEVVAAECGEGGFEDMLMRAPRGYVEPDPYTFGAIADLFDEAVDYVSKNAGASNSNSENDSAKKSLYEGIVERLKEAAKKTREFQVMAEKERKGEELTDEENGEILYVARTAEHYFLVFNSISEGSYALSNPDPMAKIADVASVGGSAPYLMAAVGNTTEWNHVVPFYGRHQIVKGAVYTYYEFEAPQILNDEEWRKRVKSQELLPWLKPFVVKQKLDAMAETGY